MSNYQEINRDRHSREYEQKRDNHYYSKDRHSLNKLNHDDRRSYNNKKYKQVDNCNDNYAHRSSKRFNKLNEFNDRGKGHKNKNSSERNNKKRSRSRGSSGSGDSRVSRGSKGVKRSRSNSPRYAKKNNRKSQNKYRSISNSRSSSSSYRSRIKSRQNYGDKLKNSLIDPEKELKNYSLQTLQCTPSKPEKELSNTLMISSLGPDINLSILEDVFREKCLEFKTSMAEDIRFIEAIRVAYIIFPSIPAATKVYESLGSSIYINGNIYQIDFTPNVSNNFNNQNPNKSSVTYITSVSDYSAYTTAMETTVHEDWICEFCGCKNFSKRVVCFKCKRPKTLNCRIIPVIKQKTTVVGEGGQAPPSTSLLIRANVIREVDEGELLEAFSQYGQVKDVRLICDKITGEPKDFAFVEYFTIEEATIAIGQMKRNPVKIRNSPIYVTFSKIRRPEDLKDNMLEPKMNSLSTLNSLGTYEVFPQQYDYGFNSSSNDLLNSINLSNLSPDEQNKLMSISNLQNMINVSQNQVSIFQQNDTRGETNLRREKELTEREKIENEMKRWKKEQKKIENMKNKSEVFIGSLKSAAINFESDSSEIGNEYESVISLDQRINQILTKTPEVTINTIPVSQVINDGFICELCQRKFPSEEKLKMHENLSALHKQNLEKLNNKII